jgi:hypothetical protein
MYNSIHTPESPAQQSVVADFTQMSRNRRNRSINPSDFVVLAK